MTSTNEWIDKKIKDGDIHYFEYNEFSNLEEVGQGAFGVVYRADWKNCGVKVALKTLKIRTYNHSINDKFLKEVII